MSDRSASSPVHELASVLAGREDLIIALAEPLAPHTTLRVGGAVEMMVRVRTRAALIDLLVLLRRHRLPLQLLGLGSNVLIPDEGLAGVVARLEGEFLEVSFRGEEVTVGAGLTLARLARVTLEQGLIGLEALAGFPSTVGGAVVMNAGCYGVEIKDVLAEASVVWPDGEERVLQTRDLEPTYRSTNLQGSGAIVTRAVFGLRRGDSRAALERLQELNRRRRQSMPSGRPNAGSIFRNPPGDYAGRLIESCGLKGRRHCGAQISAEHANVIVNNGEASAEDVFELMALMFTAVRERYGIELETEIVLTGTLRQRWRDAIGR